MKKDIIPFVVLIFTVLIYGELFAADVLTGVDAQKIKIGDTWLYTKTVGANVLNYNCKTTGV